jgi:hypothetical protein
MTTIKTPKPENQPRAVEALASIVELALPFRMGAGQQPTLSEIARLAGQASRLLRLADVDEKISVENAGTVALAKKRGLMS